MNCSMNCPENWLHKTDNEPITIYGEQNGFIDCPVYICVECKRYYIQILGVWLEVMLNPYDDWEIVEMKN